MTLEDYKKKKGGHTLLSFKKFRVILSRIVICLFLGITIFAICRLSDSTKELIKEELFQTDFNFSKINRVVNELFSNQEDQKVAMSNGISYSQASPYLNGVSLKTNEEEAINLIDSGIVVFVGNKEGYNNTIIIQQSNGIDVWYGNLENIDVKLYDYVNKNSTVASSKGELYLVFQKNGEFLDYKAFIE